MLGMICLECGYIGFVGIKFSLKLWYVIWWGSMFFLIVVVCVVFVLFGGIGVVVVFIVGVVVSGLVMFGSCDIYFCLNCEVDF